MSTSDLPGRLQVRAHGAAIQVLDARLDPVTHGAGGGHLEIDVPAGPYRIDARIGESVSSALVLVRPGAQADVELQVIFPAATQVEGTTTSHEGHQAALSFLSHALATEAASAAAGAAVIVQLRTPRGQVRDALPTNAVQLLDDQGGEVPLEVWEGTDEDGVRLSAVAVGPGRYTLVTTTSLSGRTTMDADGAAETDRSRLAQALWVPPGFQTIVTIPAGRDGLRPWALSIEHVPADTPWSPYDEQQVLTEALLAGLRNGTARVDVAQLRRLGTVPWPSPMLALLASAVALTELPVADEERAGSLRELVTDLLGHLEQLEGGAPDVAALRCWLARLDSTDAEAEVAEPPLLAPAAAEAVAAEAREPGTIPAGSPFEAILARRVRSHPWLQSQAPEPAEAATPVGAPPPVGLEQTTGLESLLDRGVRLKRVGDEGGPRLARQQPEVRAEPRSDAAAAVAAHLDEVARFGGGSAASVAQSLGIDELARRLQLPRGLMRRCLTELGYPTDAETDAEPDPEPDAEPHAEPDPEEEHPASETGDTTGHLIVTGGDGRLVRPSADQVRAQVDAAVATGRVVLHVHGGLVNEARGLRIAARLLPCYTAADAYPLFPVWRSGPVEIIAGNLQEIVRDELFDRLLRRVLRWAAGTVTADLLPGGRSVSSVTAALPSEDRLNAELGRLAIDQEPFAELDLPEDDTVDELTEDELDRFRREVRGDQDLQVLVEAAIAAEELQRPAGAREVMIEVAPRPSVIDHDALVDMAEGRFGDDAVVARSTPFAVARRLVPVLLRTLRRFRDGTHHGLYPTVLEELTRAMFLDHLGAATWQAMKKETADTFTAPDRGGRLVLDRLVELTHEGKQAQITLVGHSTGAIWIANLLRAAAERDDIPDLLLGHPVRVVFLAPAITTEELVTMYEEAGDLLGSLDVFTMNDEAEQADHVLLPALYPRSLLFLIAGILERHDGQVAYGPVAGLARYSVKDHVQRRWPDDLHERARIDEAQTYLAERATVTLFPPGPEGTTSSLDRYSHTGFDEDDQVLVTLRDRIRDGATGNPA